MDLCESSWVTSGFLLRTNEGMVRPRLPINAKTIVLAQNRAWPLGLGYRR